MDAKKSEKEWVRRISSGVPSAEKEGVDRAPAKPVISKASKRKGNGFADIAGMTELKKFVKEGFINVLKYPEYAEMFGIKPPAMLFFGPAGCGKTFFAEKMAEEVGINFMKIVPDDIASCYVHGTQQKIADVFSRAEKKAPTLLFFDEFDAMVPRRKGDAYNQHYDSEVNEFLCMLNNANERGIYVVAATNHPECMDKAVLRTGRFDEIVYIDMPDKEARKSLFGIVLAQLPKDDDIDIDRLADLTAGFNCKDIDYIVRCAARVSFNATVGAENKVVNKISQSSIENIIAKRVPSVSQDTLREYELMRSEFEKLDNGGRRRVGFI